MFYVIGYTVLALKVAVGLGFVIFVHELGHFAVAKLCGVKCDKFYLGFDFWGLRFFKFRYGETEYGIGIFPLGGYVKMLGQEDNPGRIKEEMERAKQGERGEGRGESEPQPADAKRGAADAKRGAADEKRGLGTSVPSGVGSRQSAVGSTESTNPQSPIPNPAYDPRSFLAKSVPKRMAIISAGVIMNVIFAFVMAVVAVSMGASKAPCVVGETLSGDPAWTAGLRPGDQILKIAGKKMQVFDDLRRAISLGDVDPDKGVDIEVHRPGVEKNLVVNVKPDRSAGAFLIGLHGGSTTSLLRHRDSWVVKKQYATIPGSSAAEAKPSFELGDTIVRIDDTPITNYGQIEAVLARTPDKTINVTVERSARDANGKPTGKPKRLTIPVAPNPTRDLGVVMKMGEITAVQSGSPAEAAGIKASDKILKVDGRDAGDPMRLPDELNHRAGQTVKLTLERKDNKQPIEIAVRLQKPIDLSPPLGVTGSLGVSSLGVAYTVLDKVEGVATGSLAAKAGLKPGDKIVKAKILPPKQEKMRDPDYGQSAEVLPAKADSTTWWPAMVSLLQQCLPGTTVELTYTRDDWKEPKTVTLTPVEVAGWHDPSRGFRFEPMLLDFKAKSFGEAVKMAGEETLDALTLVYRTVHKLSTNQVSMRLVSGPVMIVQVALHYADQGTPELLLFLTLLSANLAVVNFLPIPVLDGGHFVLLCYEGIRGKPAPESVQVVLSYIGLFLVLALMIWATGLDLGIFSRH
ncbi:MAG: site-2 protease family protein [Thermoguttaceae bacterium]